MESSEVLAKPNAMQYKKQKHGFGEDNERLRRPNNGLSAVRHVGPDGLEKCRVKTFGHLFREESKSQIEEEYSGVYRQQTDRRSGSHITYYTRKQRLQKVLSFPKGSIGQSRSITGSLRQIHEKSSRINTALRFVVPLEEQLVSSSN